MVDGHLARLPGAVLDGRMGNLRFQQGQLITLHEGVLELHDEIIAAVRDGNQVTEAEVEFEYASAVRAIREHYESLDFDHALEQEYNIAKGRNSPNRRVGHGVLVIRPTDHTRFFSVISAVAAAIAAGCTFVIEASSCSIDRVLENVLRCLDQEIYAMVKTPITNADFLQATLIVDQTGVTERANCLLSRPQCRSIAIVDRTANVQKAAEEIAAACAAYGGKSPHAPDLILVNEWVKKTFLEALIQISQSLRPGLRKGDRKDKILQQAERAGEAAAIHTPNFSILDIQQGSSLLLTSRGNGQSIKLLSITSLVDAVQALNSESEFLVAYHFGEPAAGKFLSQQINSQWTFVNHIPPEILIGPAMPLYHGSNSVNLRYTTEMFTKQRPEFVQLVTGSTMSLRELAQESPSAIDHMRSTKQPLKPTGQGLGTSVGFFDQGIMVGAIFIVLPTLSAVGYAAWTAVHMVWQRYVL